MTVTMLTQGTIYYPDANMSNGQSRFTRKNCHWKDAWMCVCRLHEWTSRTWVARCLVSAVSGEHVAFSVAGFHAFSAVCSCTACCSDTVITLRVGVWSARPPPWCRRDITALADTADRVNCGPPTIGGGGMYTGGSKLTGKLGKKHACCKAPDDFYSLQQTHPPRWQDNDKTRVRHTAQNMAILNTLNITHTHTHIGGVFLLRQSDLTDPARCVCRSFITSERSTLRSLISDGTARTARIFVGGFSWTAWE